MLKSLTAFTTLAMTLALAATASASADVRFEGNLKFVKKNADCDGSVKIGLNWRSSYHPGNTLAPGNNDWTGLNRTEDFAAQAWGRNGDFTTTFQKVSNGMLQAKFTGVNGDDDVNTSKTQLRLRALPPNMNGNTKFITLTGQIKNPFGKPKQATCVVDFVGTYQNKNFVNP
jgi:hypothetical protein